MYSKMRKSSGMCNSLRTMSRHWSKNSRWHESRPKNVRNLKRNSMRTIWNCKSSYANKMMSTILASKLSLTLRLAIKPSIQLIKLLRSNGSRLNTSLPSWKNNINKLTKKSNFSLGRGTRNLSLFKKINSSLRKDSKKRNSSKINLPNWLNLSPSRKKSSLKTNLSRTKTNKVMKLWWKTAKRTISRKTQTRKDKSRGGSFLKVTPSKKERSCLIRYFSQTKLSSTMSRKAKSFKSTFGQIPNQRPVWCNSFTHAKRASVTRAFNPIQTQYLTSNSTW